MAKPNKFRDKWRIRWIDEHGRRQSDVFDAFADAQFALREHQHDVELVERGLKAPRIADKTFDELISYWLDVRAVRKRSIRDDISNIKCHLRPAFGGLKLAAIDIAKVDQFITSKADLNKKTIANHLTLLISMLNVAVDLGWLTKVPRIRKPKTPLFNRDFHFLGTDEEIRRFLIAAREASEDAFVLYACAIYTGMRLGELAGLHWGDVDFDRRLITVQRSFNGPTKAEDVRYVPILDPLLPVLREWRLRTPGLIAFPNNVGHMHQPSARLFQEIFHGVLKAAGFEKGERRGKIRHYIVFHDLRHTFASHWVMKGGDLFKLQKILGHKSVQMTMRYAHLAPDAFSADYARFGSGAPVLGDGSNVVSLGKEAQR